MVIIASLFPNLETEKQNVVGFLDTVSLRKHYETCQLRIRTVRRKHKAANLHFADRSYEAGQSRLCTNG